jgi:uncharacterized damage-inducible protein DinB
MREIDRILDQLRRAFEGEAWHGPAVMEVLKGVTAEMASARPVSGVHSIWELTLHINVWEHAVLRRLRGDRALIYNTEEDWPPDREQNEAAWHATLQTLVSTNEELRAEIAKLDDRRLDEPILDEMPSVYVTLHGVIQHDIYHAGQIALLKRAILASREATG